MKFIERLKTKWDIKKSSDILAILAAFSLAGSTEAMVLKPLLHDFLAPLSKVALGLRIFIYIGIFLPIYQVLLLIYGILLGQSKFFIGRQKTLFLLIWAGCQKLVSKLKHVKH
ncbi:MAG: DUF6787 family protein [Candidatus Omnitrophota bacterium]